jgi:hypothetical protein
MSPDFAKCHRLARWIVTFLATHTRLPRPAPNATGLPGGSLRSSLGICLVASGERETPPGKPVASWPESPGAGSHERNDPQDEPGAFFGKVAAGRPVAVSRCCSRRVGWYNQGMSAPRDRPASAVQRGTDGQDRWSVAGGWPV